LEVSNLSTVFVDIFVLTSSFHRSRFTIYLLYYLHQPRITSYLPCYRHQSRIAIYLPYHLHQWRNTIYLPLSSSVKDNGWSPLLSSPAMHHDLSPPLWRGGDVDRNPLLTKMLYYLQCSILCNVGNLLRCLCFFGLSEII
jgi:hypothetical protein